MRWRTLRRWGSGPSWTSREGMELSGASRLWLRSYISASTLSSSGMVISRSHSSSHLGGGGGGGGVYCAMAPAPSFILVCVDSGASTTMQIISADASLGLRVESSLGVTLRLFLGGGRGGEAEVLLLESSAGIPTLGAIPIQHAFLDLLGGLGECPRGLAEGLHQSQVVWDICRPGIIEDCIGDHIT